jgi:multidrug transporter EmrE-like cation transporter
MNPSALVLLVLAIASEVAGSAGLKASEGFGRLDPSALAVIGYTLAFYFLAQNLKDIPLGVAYAIWSGLGTVGSVLLGLVIWKEVLGSVHIFVIALIVVGVVLNVRADYTKGYILLERSGMIMMRRPVPRSHL